MDKIREILDTRAAKTVILVLLAIVIYYVLKTIMDKLFLKDSDKTKSKKERKKETYIIAFNSFFRYIYLIVVFLLILEVNGVNISSLITGLGIVGIVVGLAVQESLKDIIMGKNILANHFFAVGDVIKFEDVTGKVLSLGLKNIKIRDIYTNNIVFITNRNIDKITNVSDWLDVDVPTPYEMKVDDIEKHMNEIASIIKQNDKIKDCQYLGINEFASSSIICKLRIYCVPENKPTIHRFALGTIKREFDCRNINIPYDQIEVHNK